MNRPNARVVEANIPSAEAPTPQQFGRGNHTPAQRREAEDITAWLKEQDDAEIEFLVMEMAMKNNRSGRRSLSW